MLIKNSNAAQARADATTNRAPRPKRRKRAEQAFHKLRDDMDWLRGALHAIDSELVEGKLDARTAGFDALIEISTFLEKHGIYSGVFLGVVSDAILSRKDIPETLKERIDEMNRRLRWKQTRPLRRKPIAERLREVHCDLTWLRAGLVRIDREFEAGQLSQGWATLCVLRQIAGFFSQQAFWKPVLSRLISSLGKRVREPRQKRKPGRKPRSALVRELSGRLAAIARLFMESGLSRDEAADRVARQTPPELATLISTKGFISPRTVKHYMDQYDCGPALLKKFEQGSERKRFETIFKRRRRRRGKAEARRQLDFLMENTPKKLEKDEPWKSRQTWNALPGLYGFAVQICLVAAARADGYNLSCDEFLRGLPFYALPENARLTDPY